MSNKVLVHYGVKGMRWGVRRNKDSGGSQRSGSKGRRSFGRKKKEDLSKLSNEELKKRITRLNLEKQYKTLTEKPKKQGMVQKIVREAASETMKKYLVAYATKAGNSLIANAKEMKTTLDSLGNL